MCPGPASLAPALLAFSLKPSSYMDHPSLASRLKRSQATRQESWWYLCFEESKYPKLDSLGQREASEARCPPVVHYCGCGPWFCTRADSYSVL